MSFAPSVGLRVKSFAAPLFFALLLGIRPVIAGTDRVDDFVSGYLKKNKSPAVQLWSTKFGSSRKL